MCFVVCVFFLNFVQYKYKAAPGILFRFYQSTQSGSGKYVEVTK